MRRNRILAYCGRCKHEQVFERATVHHWLHLVFSILTGGLWAISWIAICIGQMVRPWRCKHCGWHEPVIAAPESGHGPMREREALPSHEVDLRPAT